MHSRRSVLGLSLAGLAAALLGPARARAAGEKVLMIGDSLFAGGFGLQLERAFEQKDGFVVDRRGVVSSGLARPDFYDWFEHGAQAHAEAQPDIVLVMFGGNDKQGLYMGKQSGRSRWVRPQDEDQAWDKEYRRRINALADTLAPKDEWLFWIGMPQMRSPKLNAHVEHVNDLFREEMALRPKARFIEIWEVLADGGEFTEHMLVEGTRTRVRARDGVHISPAGGKKLARNVRPRILAHLS